MREKRGLLTLKTFITEMRYWFSASKLYGNTDMRLEVVGLAFWFYVRHVLGNHRKPQKRL